MNLTFISIILKIFVVVVLSFVYFSNASFENGVNGGQNKIFGNNNFVYKNENLLNQKNTMLNPSVEVKLASEIVHSKKNFI